MKRYFIRRIDGDVVRWFYSPQKEPKPRNFSAPCALQQTWAQRQKDASDIHAAHVEDILEALKQAAPMYQYEMIEAR